MSGLSSRSTFTFTKCSFIMRAVSSSSKDSRSITWHQWHALYPTESRTGLSSSRALFNASSPQGYQSTGLSLCWSRYGLVSFASLLAILSLPRRPGGGLFVVTPNVPQVGWSVSCARAPSCLARGNAGRQDTERETRARRQSGHVLLLQGPAGGRRGPQEAVGERRTQATRAEEGQERAPGGEGARAGKGLATGL